MTGVSARAEGGAKRGGGRLGARLGSAGLDLLAPPLVLLAVFTAFVRNNGYPLWAPEVLRSAGGLAAAGLGVGVLAALGGTAFRVPLTAALLALFVDLQFEVFRAWDRTVGLGLGGAVAAAWLLRAHLSAVVCAVFGTMLAATLLLPAPRDRAEAPARHAREAREGDRLPIVLHLILDEQIGLEGIPEEFDPDGAFRSALRGFYEEWGFRVFARAYSRYWHTHNSIPSLFNVEALDKDSVWFKGGWFSEGAPLQRSLYLERMAARGYTIHVYESDYIGLCQPLRGVGADRCVTYPIKTIKAIEASPLDVAERADFIRGVFARLSFFHGQLARAYGSARLRLAARGWNLPWWVPPQLRMSAVATMQVLDRLEADVAAARPGELFVAHLLLPHYPYSYDARCELRRPPRAWQNAFDLGASGHVNNPSARALRYPLYLEQVLCVQRRLGALFERLRAAGRLDDMVVILHGDHGSRLEIVPPRLPYRDRQTVRDLTDAFSTLFAVRDPAIPPGYDRRLLPLDVLLPAALEHRVPGEEADGIAPEVFLYSGRGRFLTPRPLLEFGSPPAPAVAASGSATAPPR